ncbi:MAG: histidine kinase [Pseudomonadota bacterium]
MDGQAKNPIAPARNMPEDRQYWTCQFAGWGAMALLSYLSLTVWYNPGQLAPILHTILQSLLGVAVSHPLRWIATRSWQAPFERRALINGAAVIAASLVWTGLRITTFTWLTGEVIPFQDWGGWAFASVIVFGAWSFCYHAIKYYRLSSEQRRLAAEAQTAALRAQTQAQHESFKRLEAEKLFKETQLRMLKYQLNPHFFLNALNSVSALVMRGDKQGAMEMLARIGDFLRVSLDDPEEIQHTLDEELDALSLYLSIEKVRFGERLRTQFDIDDAARSILLPNLLLQPIVENAIKFAVSEKREPTNIVLSAVIDQGELVLRVTDDGPGLGAVEDVTDAVGIGLANVRQRLESTFGNGFQFRLTNAVPTGVEVEIRIAEAAFKPKVSIV